jgi:hypothetical protein
MRIRVTSATLVGFRERQTEVLKSSHTTSIRMTESRKTTKSSFGQHGKQLELASILGGLLKYPNYLGKHFDFGFTQTYLP